MRRVTPTRALDPRARSRAVIGAVLGLVAILLGISGAIYLPRVMDRADRFIGSVQDDVNKNVALVNNGTQRDVDRLDRTLTRDLLRFENQNKSDVTGFEQRTSAALTKLEIEVDAGPQVRVRRVEGRPHHARGLAPRRHPGARGRAATGPSPTSRARSARSTPRITAIEKKPGL